MESDDDSDAPDSIVPASSPESQLGDETTRFPHLLDPKEEEDERAISPVIPIIPRSAIPSMWHYLEIIFIFFILIFHDGLILPIYRFLRDKTIRVSGWKSCSLIQPVGQN